ncbi:MAG: AbrB/MazE/SpoVT family DNA-binding domain-containing protein [Burkholderiaceae bacterium]
MHTFTARLFDIDGDQAVRLPPECRFEGVNEVHIRRDERTGDVILSTRSAVDWHAFMALCDRLGSLPDDFPGNRAQAEQLRDPFKRWVD